MSLDPKNSADGSHPSTQFRVGDYVDVDGQKHRIDSIWRGLSDSPTGVRLLVVPPCAYGNLVEGVCCSPWRDDGLSEGLDEPDDGLSAGL